MSDIVTCGQCLRRQAEIVVAEARSIRGTELFRITARVEAQPVMFGHAMYQTYRGIATLCAAEKQSPPTYYNAKSS